MIDKRCKHYRQSKRVVKQWLIVLLVIVTLVYLFTPPKTPISPLASTSVVFAVEPSPEPTIAPRTPSKGVQGCVKNHPYVSERIEKLTDDPFNAKELICRESSFNPTVVNPSSGSCGLAQALPCSKMKCDLADVDCQINWISEYVYKRYGSFEEAILFHDRMNWY